MPFDGRERTHYILLGIRLAWPKATVFEIVIIGSNPISPASFRMHPAKSNQFKTFIFEKKLHPVI